MALFWISRWARSRGPRERSVAARRCSCGAGMFLAFCIDQVGATEQFCAHVVLHGNQRGGATYFSEWAACADGVVIAQHLNVYASLINS